MKPLLHIATLITVMLTGCDNKSRRAQENLPVIDVQTNHTGGKWHFSGFDEVRAYRMNWDELQSEHEIVNRDGSLNPTRIPEYGVRLTEAQVERLEAAVTGTHPDHPHAGCFYPHHAFLFFDSSRRIVGHIDICFLCSNYSGHPAGYATNWDLGQLEELIKDIGVPLLNPKWPLPARYLKHKSGLNP
jgi:hypothetical protein